MRAFSSSALSAFLLLGLLPGALPAQDLTAEAAHLLARARDNQAEGAGVMDVLGVRTSDIRGEDSLRGWMEFRDARGERRLFLSGAGESFEWWSRFRGAEQWRRDAVTGRLRRIPLHALRKPALDGAPLSYEDLVRFPLGYLDGLRACRRLFETDSTYELALVLSPAASALYPEARVSLGKNPVLVRRIVFHGAAGRPEKTLEVPAYRIAGIAGGAGFQGGKHAPAEARFVGADGRMTLRLFFTPGSDVSARDKTAFPEGPPPGRNPSWEAREREGTE